MALVTYPEQNSLQSFLVALKQYLHDFHADLTHATRWEASMEWGSIWSRPSGPTLHLSPDEIRRYHRLLGAAHADLAPSDDLSEAAIDSALKDAVFAVVDLPGTRATDVEVRVQAAVDAFRVFIETPSRDYECWIEVEGLDAASLPAEFGPTRFTVLGDTHIDNVVNLVEEKHTVAQKPKLEFFDWIAEDIQGRSVAIQRVKARDASAAVLLAEHEVQATIECLNFFAALIPYNRARLRMPSGRLQSGDSLQMAVADDGSFTHNRQATHPWTFSMDKLRELAGPVSEALKRVESIRSNDGRSEVDELLLRAVRWAGRAAAAGTREDKFLNAMISLECVMLPKQKDKLSAHLAARTARMLNDEADDTGELERKVKRLYDLRSRLVHDGSLDITEDDQAALWTITLSTVVCVLNSSDIDRIFRLNELHEYFNKLKPPHELGDT